MTTAAPVAFSGGGRYGMIDGLLIRETTGYQVVSQFSYRSNSGGNCPAEPGGPPAQRAMAAGSSENVGLAVGGTWVSGSPRVAGAAADAARRTAASARRVFMGRNSF